eukprot:2665201-Prymnesium_polylepis.1
MGAGASSPMHHNPHPSRSSADIDNTTHTHTMPHQHAPVTAPQPSRAHSNTVVTTRFSSILYGPAGGASNAGLASVPSTVISIAGSVSEHALPLSLLGVPLDPP